MRLRHDQGSPPSPANPAYVIDETPPMARVGEVVLAVALVAVSARLFIVERRGRDH